MCTARLFSQGVDLFTLKFYLDRVIPILGIRKLETLGYPMVTEDRIPPGFLVLTQYRSVTDGQTDRRTDRFAVAYCKNLNIVIILLSLLLLYYLLSAVILLKYSFCLVLFILL